MWIRVDNDEVATSFKKDDRIRVDCRGRIYEGLLLHVEFGKSTESTFVRLTQSGSDYPITLYVWAGRKFYRWDEDKPVSAADVERMESQARLRLRKPNPDQDPEVQAEVESAEAALLTRIERLEQTVQRVVQVGTQQYVINEGDHLRVWWEDGRLHTEFIQGEKK